MEDRDKNVKNIISEAKNLQDTRAKDIKIEKGKIWITNWQDGILAGVRNGRRMLEMQYTKTTDGQAKVGDIFVGHVKDVVKNLEAAFVEYEKGKKGYYSFRDNTCPLFLNRKQTDKVCEGDYLLVQIKKEGVKTKDPVLTSHINLTGKYCVLTVGKNYISVSKKIKDDTWKKEVTTILREKFCVGNYDFGLIIRTNAYTQPIEQIIRECEQLQHQWEQIKEIAKNRTIYSKVYEEVPEYLKFVDGNYGIEIEEVVTDCPELYEKLCQYEVQHQYEMQRNHMQPQPDVTKRDDGKCADIKNVKSSTKQNNNRLPIRLYEDKLLPLYKLYQVEKYIEEALSKKVWLKSGAYLIIEQTEACTVIDVNSGKYESKKQTESAFLKLNKEAAAEIALQVRLRNLSGIIIVDFINMKEQTSRDELVAYLQGQLYADPVGCYFVDYTKLGLAELTRKKVRKTLGEQLYL